MRIRSLSPRTLSPKLVRLRKERPKDMLPRLAKQAPPPVAQQNRSQTGQRKACAADATKPKPTPKLSKKAPQKVPQTNRSDFSSKPSVSNALSRLKSLTRPKVMRSPKVSRMAASSVKPQNASSVIGMLARSTQVSKLRMLSKGSTSELLPWLEKPS